VREFDVSSAKLAGGSAYGDHSGHENFVELGEHVPFKESSLASLGKLFAVIACKNPHEGQCLFENLKNNYYKSGSSPFGSLKESMERLGASEAVAMALSGDTVSLAATGGARVWLKRGSETAQILVSEKGGITTGSGHLKPGDKIMLATSSTFSVLSKKKLTKALSEEGARLSIEALGPVISSAENTEEVGLVIIDVFSSEGVPAPHIKGQPQKGINLKLKAVGVIDRALSLLPEKRFSVGRDTRDLESIRRSRTSIAAGSILLVVLAISIFFGIRQSVIKNRKEKYEDRLNQAKHELSEARSLSELNSPRARELVLSAREKVLGVYDEGFSDPELDLLSTELNDALGKVAGIYESDPSLFLDLSMVDGRFKGSQMVVSDGEMRILDRESKLVISVRADTKSTKVVKGPDLLDDVLQVAAYSDRSFVLSSDGIREIGDNVMLFVRPDWDLDTILVKAFAGNIYVLDKPEGQIWRYTGGGQSFSEKQEWLAKGIEVDLSKVNSWAIDGSIWFLSEGKISRFEMGAPKAFSVPNIGKPFPSANILFTDENSSYLYVYDPESNRVVVLTKEGEYEAEYLIKNISKADAMVVSEADQKIFLLDGNRLLFFEASHLK